MTSQPRPRKADPLPRLRKICLALPDTWEKLSHGEPAFFVGKKQFASYDNHHHGAPHISVWCSAPPGAQQVLVNADPDRFFVPPYVGQRGWVAIVLDNSPDWGEVAAVIEEAYLNVASERLRKLRMSK
jgi:hypothetical protein